MSAQFPVDLTLSPEVASELVAEWWRCSRQLNWLKLLRKSVLPTMPVSAEVLTARARTILMTLEAGGYLMVTTSTETKAVPITTGRFSRIRDMIQKASEDARVSGRPVMIDYRPLAFPARTPGTYVGLDPSTDGDAVVLAEVAEDGTMTVLGE